MPRNAPTLLLALILVTPYRAQAQDRVDWNIEESRAPSTTSLRFTATEGTWISLDISPDGSRMAFDLLGHIYEMPIEGGDAVALTSGRSWNGFPRYSPDGARIAFTSDRGGSEDVWILHRGTDSLENVTEMALPVVQGSWSADGRAVYASAIEQDASTTAYRFNLFGARQELTSGTTFQPITHFGEHPERGVLFFEHRDRQIPASGARIKTYDLETAEIRVYRERPGGAFNPALSPDGRFLAYGHREDQETILVLHDLETRSERILVRGLDRDHQESNPYYYGTAANMDWHPDGTRLYLTRGGGILEVNVASGETREVPFRAPVDREIDETIRFPFEFPEGETRAWSYRFAQRTPAGIVFEALGDIWLAEGGEVRNLTQSAAHETSPAVDAEGGWLYYATWTDEDLGAIHRRPLAGGAATSVSSRPSQYMAVTPGPGSTLAFIRGAGGLINGTLLEEEAEFELIVVEDGVERRVTGVAGTSNAQGRGPHTVRFDETGEWIYYTEFLSGAEAAFLEPSSDALVLRRIRPDGTGKTTLYGFPHGERAIVSPDGRWIAFREYHRSFVTPFEWIGRPVAISAYDGLGFTKRIDPSDGAGLAWSDTETVSWPRGGSLHEKKLDHILAGTVGTETTDLTIRYDVALPTTTVALTNARVLTMDEERSVLEDATILVRGHRIAEVGLDVVVPPEARVFDLAGHTVIPGLVDAHAHAVGQLAATHLVEQRLSGITAALAHGVTTLYELYGSEEKEPWVRDMIWSGRMEGPRMLSVGAPMYGIREYRPRTYRPVDGYADADEHARYSRDQGITALKDYIIVTRSDRHQLITAAREQGLNVLSETAAIPEMNFTQIIDGVTGLEHSMGLTPLYRDVVELFRASDTGVSPTLLVVYNGPQGQAFFDQSQRYWEDAKLLRFETAERLRRFRRVTHYWEDDLYAPEMVAAMKRLFDAGVLVNSGGHGQMLGRDMHWEMELFVQGGFSPMDALQTATRNAAVYHGLGADLGSIEPGKLADLVVLGANRWTTFATRSRSCTC
ncbi:amidohydrolase family protein [Candidatus Palauibacter sp.]|uniref:amidohydrolase family protein n=1 Tax=Candidatus Palauibacter sp. TaxID=3101350 RepID=UPI003B01BAD4